MSHEWAVLPNRATHTRRVDMMPRAHIAEIRVHGRTHGRRKVSVAHLDDVERDGCAVLVTRIDVPLQIHIKELEDEVQFLVRVHDL